MMKEKRLVSRKPAPNKPASRKAAPRQLARQLSAAPVSPNPPFSEAAMKFLRGLERHNDREWFEARKGVYERELKEPMLRLIAAITDAMAEFAPQHMRPAQKIMMRIYRDTRFSADKTPYKTRVSAWWSREGLEKTSGGGFYMHVSSKEVVIAAGVFMPEKEQLYAIRSFMLDHHEEVRSLLNDRRMRGVLGMFDGLALTRSPKGFPKEHAALDLLLCRQWGVSADLPAEAALSSTLFDEIVKRFSLAAPLVELLNRPLVRALQNRKRGSLFPMPGAGVRR